MKKGGKFMLAGFSGILIVAVVIGVVVSVKNSNSSSDSKNNDVLSTTSKSVAAICSPTEFKQACVDSLTTVAKNQSANPKDFLQAALQYTVSAVKTALSNTTAIGKSAKDSYNKMAMEDCKELLQYAVDELQASFSMVGDSSLHTMKDREYELLNWLGAVYSYQSTCVDAITQTDLRKSMSDGLLNDTQLTNNAISILASISQILTAFNIPMIKTTAITNASSQQRRLLEASGVEENGDNEYPSWLSAADRKLLSRATPHSNVRPNAVVAKDGSGQFKTIAAALAAYPKNLQGRYVIYVKAGIYDEYITVQKNQVNVFMYGDGPRKTMITGKKSNTAGFTTFQTASFSAIGDGFIAKGMGFQNTAGPQGHQAVALRVQSDRAAFYNCRMDGYQDTLYAQAHRNFYRNCVISGTVDFIFGTGATLIQNCLIIVRKPMDGQQNTVTAHGRAIAGELSGIVIQNSRIVPEQKLYPARFQIPTYLGRPWKMYSRAVIIESTLGDFINPAGWMPWQGNFALDTCFFAEYANRGPGAATGRRVNWKGHKIITNRAEAMSFTAVPFLKAQEWLPATGAPFFYGLKH